MDFLEVSLDEVESPCISVCKIDPTTGYCFGCWRTRVEISGWSEKSSEDRWEIIRNMHKRRKAARGRRPTVPPSRLI